MIALAPGGFGVLDFILVALFAMTLPWFVIGFWNATIGFLIMRFARDPVAAVLPVADGVKDGGPIVASTAILLCIRNEPMERVAGLLSPLLDRLATSGCADRFHFYVLSDTNKPDNRSGGAVALRSHGEQVVRPCRPDLSPPPQQYRLQSRQHPRFLRALGPATRPRRHARRRQRHDRRAVLRLVRIMQADAASASCRAW